jgi:hypothetical protein
MKGKALLLATWVLPVSAMAQDAAPGPSGSLDVYLLPDTNVEARVPSGGGSADEKGDGYGVRGLVHMSDLLMITGEYQSASYDDIGGQSADRTDFRVGGGVGLPNGTGLFTEFVKIGDDDGRGGSGFGVHGRWAGSVIPRLALHAQAGYVQVEDDERFGGFEFSVGGAYAITNMLGAMIDYRVNSLEAHDSQLELKLRDLRLGVRWNFGATDAPAADVGDGEEDVSVEPVEGEATPEGVSAEEVPAGETPADAPAEEAPPEVSDPG